MKNTPSQFFFASCMALIVTAMSFALRGEAMGFWTEEFNLSNESVGWVTGTAFWGFTLAMIFGGPLCDILGLKTISLIAFFGHVASILLTVFAWDFWSLYLGTLLFGIANGSVEAACNPLIATLYPKDKTTKLNNFHVWFPGGIVIGSLLAFFLGKVGFGWRYQFAVMLIPSAIYGWYFLRMSFPKTERVEAGISTAAMFKSCLNPLFILMVLCMLMTAATELATTNWLPIIFSSTDISGILVVAYIFGLMAVGRQFAGAFVHRLSPIGMLIASAVFSGIGLYLMSHSTGMIIFASATVFAIGVCFFWPTMLGYVSERFPSTGALGLAIMGGAGMLSVSFVLPTIGKFYDNGIASNLPEGQTVETLSAAEPGSQLAEVWAQVQNAAGLSALEAVAILPVALLIIFTLLRVLDPKSKLGDSLEK
ncbi:MAG: MFS transporter [Opitutales bacterium]|nr:MFS transporter [Opitutales bacterium]